MFIIQLCKCMHDSYNIYVAICCTTWAHAFPTEWESTVQPYTLVKSVCGYKVLAILPDPDI